MADFLRTLLRGAVSCGNSGEGVEVGLGEWGGMSTSRALPVMRTPDLREAYEAVQRLLGLALPLDNFHVNVETQALTLAEAQRLVAAFPTAPVYPAGR
ncbi:hypothetical protein [Kitasatospora sp. NPDC101183]|uniref:hypothetical protein n=1 Tax=Kitasatospora sp. NPDC101183 TaxID=3364100 RepID=UPI0037FB082A